MVEWNGNGNCTNDNIELTLNTLSGDTDNMFSNSVGALWNESFSCSGCRLANLKCTLDALVRAVTQLSEGYFHTVITACFIHRKVASLFN